MGLFLRGSSGLHKRLLAAPISPLAGLAKNLQLGHLKRLDRHRRSGLVHCHGAGLQKISRILLLKPLHFLGKISYSFYLFHVLILFGLLHLLYGSLPFPAIVAMVVIASFAISAISYRWIEIPFIRLGKHLSKGG